MPERVDIYLQRNEDWGRDLLLTYDGGEPVDLTGMSVGLQVRERLSQAFVAAGECEIIDAPNGQISIVLRASEGSSLTTFGPAIQTANLFYDCRLTDGDGFSTILFGGMLVLSRGETTR